MLFVGGWTTIGPFSADTDTVVSGKSVDPISVGHCWSSYICGCQTIEIDVTR